MDKFCPISSSEQNEEDQLGFSNTISIPTFEFQPPQQQQYINQENIMPNHTLANSLNMDSFLNYSSSFGHGRVEFHQTTFDDNNLGHIWQDNIWASSASGNVDFDNNDKKQKKIVHKETERQRRCQMTNLYASLKSLLPSESTKGRQTTSELIHAAENHIKVEQKNIEELRIQRDNLKKLTNTQNNNLNGSSNETSSSFPCNYLPADVSVRSYLGGMEILISIDLRMDGFQLSRVLELVRAEGLCVVSYVCTRINGKMLHTIQTEVCHLEVTDSYDLKQKLVDII